MTRRLPIVAALAAATFIVPVGTAQATVASGALTGLNGYGSFNNTLPCGIGDGPNWRYFWEDGAASSPGGLLLGTWNGSFEVHDAGNGGAFIPDGDGRISITLDRGDPTRAGTGHFDTLGGGGCGNANLALTTQPDGDPQVSGTLPIVATGGSGAFRGLTGSGTATFTLELGPGADNVADIDMTADLDVADPQLSIVGASSRWANTSAYLQKRLTVFVTVANAPGDFVGNAYDVRLTGVGGGTNWFEGVPTGPATIPAGGGATYAFTMRGAAPNKQYTLSVTATGKDGMLAPQPPVNGGVTFKSPLLP